MSKNRLLRNQSETRLIVYVTRHALKGRYCATGPALRQRYDNTPMESTS
ncbi:hypothetical protein [Pseudomonas sp. HLT2-19-2]